jgi:hypothetical protein
MPCFKLFLNEGEANSNLWKLMSALDRKQPLDDMDRKAIIYENCRYLIIKSYRVAFLTFTRLL